MSHYYSQCIKKTAEKVWPWSNKVTSKQKSNYKQIMEQYFFMSFNDGQLSFLVSLFWSNLSEFTCPTWSFLGDAAEAQPGNEEVDGIFFLLSFRETEFCATEWNEEPCSVSACRPKLGSVWLKNMPALLNLCWNMKRLSALVAPVDTT